MTSSQKIFLRVMIKLTKLAIEHFRTLGDGLGLACNGGISLKCLMSLAFKMTPYINRACKLVPVQYPEYEYGLSANHATVEGQPRLQPSVGSI